MALYSLPAIVEDVFASYLAANYTGSHYTVTKAFSSGQYVAPLLLVKAGSFKEIEPNTDVYEGALIIGIITQADDAASTPKGVLAIHDETVGIIYQLMRAQSAVIASVNASGNNFQLWGYYNSGYDQEHEERDLKTMLTYSINCQNQSLS